MSQIIVRKSVEADRDLIISYVLEGFSVDFSPFVVIFGEETVRAFLHRALQWDLFFVAEKDDLPVATLAIGNAKRRPLTASTAVAKKEFNPLKSKIACLGLMEYEEELSFDENIGYIEFVAVNPDHCRQGIATQLLLQSMDQTPYEEFILDVKNNNPFARSCYEKLGFKEVSRKKAGFNLEPGFKEKIFMGRSK